MKAKKGKVSVMTGNVVAANAARLCRPEVVACYPITPQSEVAETAFRRSWRTACWMPKSSRLKAKTRR